VTPNPVGALEFVLAGSLSEGSVLGDYVKGGFVGDQKVWRQGLGATGELTREDLDELAGGSLGTVIERVREWAAMNRPRIVNVAAKLAGADDLTTPGHARCGRRAMESYRSRSPRTRDRCCRPMKDHLSEVIDEMRFCTASEPETPLMPCMADTQYLVILTCEGGHERLVPLCKRHKEMDHTSEGPIGLCELCEEIDRDSKPMRAIGDFDWAEDHPALIPLAQDRADLDSL
jgi:hypothetical protein